uniref:Uncharacterized protein n=1 Tax=Tanacetum cinerariifolium TaxID=118510 RepID=A0A6L2KXF1_TANCI|nr:hypothetical protein [Tanacetum cinerariifolium]
MRPIYSNHNMAYNDHVHLIQNLQAYVILRTSFQGVEAINSTIESVEAKTSTTKGVNARNSTTEGVEAKTSTKDKGKEKVSENASDVVETRRCTVEVNSQTKFWHVIPTSGNLFEVRSESKRFTVDEGKRTCSCRM